MALSMGLPILKRAAMIHGTTPLVGAPCQARERRLKLPEQGTMLLFVHRNILLTFLTFMPHQGM